MNEAKRQAAISSKIICLVKWMMGQYGITEDVAYEKLLGTELYRILTDTETGFYLEPIEYVCECCRIEMEEGKEQLLDFVSII